jgi:pimeloyl-ACP methyl ester carboxylesterase
LSNQRLWIEGVELEVLRIRPESGDPELPAIIMLHEGLGSVAMWKQFPHALAARTGREVVVYSRAGYGESGAAQLPRKLTYMHDEGLRVLPALIDALELSDPILLGHSDGGSIALICAGGSDTGLDRVIVMAPHIFVEQLTVDSIALAKVAWRETDLAQRLGKYHADVESAFIGWNDIWLHPEFFDWNIEEYLPQIRVPVLAIQGQNDEYGTMAQIDGIAKQLPGSETLKLPNCRHSPHKDQPEAVLSAIETFIESPVPA